MNRSSSSAVDVLSNSTKTSLLDAVVSLPTERHGLGAAYFVVAVILVYGVSIMMLIASHIKHKSSDTTEDQQADHYLRDLEVTLQFVLRNSFGCPAVDRCLRLSSQAGRPAPTECVAPKRTQTDRSSSVM